MLKKYDEILLVNLDKLTYAGNLENLKGVEGDSRHVFVPVSYTHLNGRVAGHAAAHRQDALRHGHAFDVLGACLLYTSRCV